MRFDEIFQRVLVIAPHFDDEVIGCAGTICKFREQITRLAIVHLTDATNERKKEYAEVQKILTPDQSYSLSLRDGFLLQNYEEGVTNLTNIIQRERPTLIFVPHSHDQHPDHKAANIIGIDAISKSRYSNQNNVHYVAKTIFEYEVWFPIKSPSVTIDITEFFETKKKLVSMYESQLTEFPYHKYIEYLNGWRGLLFNKDGFAEVFTVRTI